MTPGWYVVANREGSGVMAPGEMDPPVGMVVLVREPPHERDDVCYAHWCNCDDWVIPRAWLRPATPAEVASAQLDLEAGL